VKEQWDSPNAIEKKKEGTHNRSKGRQIGIAHRQHTPRGVSGQPSFFFFLHFIFIFCNLFSLFSEFELF
jgi:hypothetical protein